MTVSAQTTFIEYTGAGLTGPYAIPFRFTANGDLVVKKIDSEGVETTLTGNTISGAGNPSGGELYTALAVAVGYTLLIYRQTPLTQPADYIAGASFPAETHEGALDRLTLIAQDNRRDINRSFKVSMGDDAPADTTWDALIEEAGAAVGADALAQVGAAGTEQVGLINAAGASITGVGGTIDIREDTALAAIDAAGEGQALTLQSITGAEVYASTAEAVSNGVIGLSGLVAGSGGTNGTFSLAFSGGAGSGAAGRFVVAGGVVTSVHLTAPGVSYTSAPTVSFAASSGLSGASVTAVIGVNEAPGETFMVKVTNGFEVRKVDGGGTTATAIDTLPNLSATQASNPLYVGGHDDGALHEWRFDELAGNTVYDRIGTANIDLTLPTSPNVTWTKRGVKTLAGLVQTSAMTSARTIAIVYRVPVGSTGFIISGSAGGSGTGIIDNNISTYTCHYGSGETVRVPYSRNDGVSPGSQAYEIAAGGFGVLFYNPGANFSTAVGFGGRHSTTTSRCPEMELCHVKAWNDVLTDDERLLHFRVMARAMLPRGVYLKNEDCPEQVEVVLALGESDMSGRGPFADATYGISAADQAFRFLQTQIQSGKGGTPTTRARLRLGTNQMVTDGSHTAAAKMGFEIGIAQGYELSANRGRELVICKTALGGTRSCPSGITGAGVLTTAGTTWNAAEFWHFGLLSFTMRDWYRLDQGLRLEGKGVTLRAVIMALGKNDAVDTTCTTDAATYQARRQAIFDFIKAATAFPNLQWVEFETPTCTGDDATARGHVRDGVEAFRAVDPANRFVVDTDSMPKLADGVHYVSQSLLDGGKTAIALVSFS